MACIRDSDTHNCMSHNTNIFKGFSHAAVDGLRKLLSGKSDVVAYHCIFKKTIGVFLHVIDPGLTRYRVGRRFSLDSNRSRHVNV